MNEKAVTIHNMQDEDQSLSRSGRNKNWTYDASFIIGAFAAGILGSKCPLLSCWALSGRTEAQLSPTG